ncbi:MAG: MlaD family protein [Thermoleophilaceae bacterium]
MRRLLTAVCVLALLGAGAVLVGAKGEGTPSGTTYKIIFDNAFGLADGGDFRVGGVKAGATPSFKATSANPPKAEVTAKITVPGFGAFHKDATCTIKPQSLIGEYYVDCQPGSKDAPKLKKGATIPLSHTTSTIPQDLVNNILRRPYKERLRLIINELGTGLAGRPRDLQAVLRRAHPGLRETQKTLQILAKQSTTIEKFIASSDTVVSELERRKTDVTRFIREAGETAQTTATRRAQLRTPFAKLPGFLDELTPTMQRLGEFTDQANPLLSDAQRAAPSLNTFLTRLGPFATASRPALKSLGKTSVKGTRAFKDSANEIDELKKLAATSAPTAKPLAQLLNSLDDRRRAIDNDPRGKVGGPPASDISNRGKANNGGFTGLEAFWSYFFWQTLSLNGFDNVSHMLRIGATVGECSPLENRTLQSNPELKGKFERCGAILGPNSPGNTSPDFTKGAQAASLAKSGGKPASAAGERRSAGQPDAGPVAGQRDISKPQVTLPPAVQQLLHSLPKSGGKAAKAPAVDPAKVQKVRSGSTPGGSQQLLDYLLAP